MPGKILCVAEKPSIAKAVAGHLSGGQFTVRESRNRYVKNYDFTFDFRGSWGPCNVTFTSVLGHTFEWDFTPAYKNWQSPPPFHLFEAPVLQRVSQPEVADNIRNEARYATALFIWTDCDREGEYIGKEVRDIAWKVKPRLEVKRAKFSNIERAHVMTAALRPVMLDERQAEAVAARIELDLRIGAAFTRFQTLQLQTLESLKNQVLSYGSCQFPTLGFVVDRYRRVKDFVPEPFWSIKVSHRKDGINVNFSWDRNRLFDRMTVTLLYERCLQARVATITKITKKPTKKWKPLPLTTVELQKLGSRFLHLTSAQVMTIAEKLYTSGFISYPRTETDQFDPNTDFTTLISKQSASPDWGGFAQNLLAGAFSPPRAGRNNDQAHPPIHPVAYVAPHSLSPEEARVYQFITRRFLAACSTDAVGATTTINMQYSSTEFFHASGLLVIERNYLDVYPYDKWESSQQLPEYAEGETLIPDEALMTEGKTTAPGFLTEPELIALMDANGIGTDATMAEHISKIKERQYVFTRPKGGGSSATRGSTRGRARGGRGRGRGGGGGGDDGVGGGGRGGGGGVEEFLPSTLGLALIEGYDCIGFESSLSKPFLRKEMEEKMKRICEGRMAAGDVVHESLEGYREMFAKTAKDVVVLKAMAKYYCEDKGEFPPRGPIPGVPVRPSLPTPVESTQNTGTQVLV